MEGVAYLLPVLMKNEENPENCYFFFIIRPGIHRPWRVMRKTLRSNRIREPIRECLLFACIKKNPAGGGYSEKKKFCTRVFFRI